MRLRLQRLLLLPPTAATASPQASQTMFQHFLPEAFFTSRQRCEVHAGYCLRKLGCSSLCLQPTMHTGITPEFSEMGIEEYTPWEGWSEEDKSCIEEHMSYYRNKIQEMQCKLELLTKCYAKGRLSEDPFVKIKVLKKPKSDLKAAILENRNADTFANKQDEDLIAFLEKHKITDNVMQTDFDVHTRPTNLQELSLAIKQINAMLIMRRERLWVCTLMLQKNIGSIRHCSSL